MRIKNLFPALLAGFVALGAAGCVVAVDGVQTNPRGAAGDRQPVIQAFDYNPKSGITKDDTITFTLVASDPEGMPLQYTWSSTRGLLTANTGAMATWKPLNTKGELDPGLATVMVVVSDGRQTSSASLNIQVAPSGEISVIPSGEPVPAATPTPTPTATPSATTAASDAAQPDDDATGAADADDEASAPADADATGETAASGAN